MEQPVAAIARSTVSAGVADRLITAIAVGMYSPGERLPPEREIAQMFSVSRVTVREALRQVTELGLVTARRGRDGGTFVTKVSWEEIAPETARRTLEIELPRLHDLYDYRCMVEGMIARAAAERRTADDIVELTKALEEFRNATEMAGARQLDRRLHGLVSRAAHNRYLSSLSAQLTAEATLGFGAEPYTEQFFTQALGEHDELIRHVVHGDANAANRSAQTHFRMTVELMKAGLTRASGRS